MKSNQWLYMIGIILFVVLNWVSAKDDGPKIKGEIVSLDVDALILTIADMTF